MCYRISPIIQPALAHHEGKALNFGCCELRFLESIMTTAKARALPMVDA